MSERKTKNYFPNKVVKEVKQYLAYGAIAVALIGAKDVLTWIYDNINDSNPLSQNYRSFNQADKDLTGQIDLFGLTAWGDDSSPLCCSLVSDTLNRFQNEGIEIPDNIKNNMEYVGGDKDKIVINDTSYDGRGLFIFPTNYQHFDWGKEADMEKYKSMVSDALQWVIQQKDNLEPKYQDLVTQLDFAHAYAIHNDALFLGLLLVIPLLIPDKLPEKLTSVFKKDSVNDNIEEEIVRTSTSLDSKTLKYLQENDGEFPRDYFKNNSS